MCIDHSKNKLPITTEEHKLEARVAKSIRDVEGLLCN
jgi:hypothetical protein